VGISWLYLFLMLGLASIVAENILVVVPLLLLPAFFSCAAFVLSTVFLANGGNRAEGIGCLSLSLLMPIILGLVLAVQIGESFPGRF